MTRPQLDEADEVGLVIRRPLLRDRAILLISLTELGLTQLAACPVLY